MLVFNTNDLKTSPKFFQVNYLNVPYELFKTVLEIKLNKTC